MTKFINGYQLGESFDWGTAANQGISTLSTLLNNLVDRYTAPTTTTEDKSQIASQIAQVQSALNQKILMVGGGLLLAGVVLYAVTRKR
jgi:hypothetical protein